MSEHACGSDDVINVETRALQSSNTSGIARRVSGSLATTLLRRLF